jgi:hypothetical protein
MSTGYIWLRIWISGVVLWRWQWPTGVHKNAGMSWLTEWVGLLCYGEGFCATDLIWSYEYGFDFLQFPKYACLNFATIPKVFKLLIDYFFLQSGNETWVYLIPNIICRGLYQKFLSLISVPRDLVDLHAGVYYSKV